MEAKKKERCGAFLTTSPHPFRNKQKKSLISRLNQRIGTKKGLPEPHINFFFEEAF